MNCSSSTFKKGVNNTRLCHTYQDSYNIRRYDLYDFPELAEYNRGYSYYKFHIDHEKVKDFLANKETPLEPLPLASAVYIGKTGENIYYNAGRLNFNLINRRHLTSSIVEDFSLYKISE